LVAVLMGLQQQQMSGTAANAGAIMRSCWCARGAWAPSTAALSARRRTGGAGTRGSAGGCSRSGRLLQQLLLPLDWLAFIVLVLTRMPLGFIIMLHTS
jgi:hypothetical protein